MSSIKQLSFSSGEITPSLYARADISRYYTSLKKCRNFIVKKQGGLDNRPGSKFITEVKDSSKTVRLIEFVFNNDQTYVMEFGDEYIRFIKNDAYVEVSGLSDWDSGTTYAVGDLVVYNATNYYCKAISTGNTPPNATYWHQLTGDIYEIPSPYDYLDLPEIRYAQNADTVIFTHKSYPIKKLIRSGDTSWVLSNFEFGSTISPIDDLLIDNDTGGTLDARWVVTAVSFDGEESSVSNSVRTDEYDTAGETRTLTWTAVPNAAYYNVYRLHAPTTYGSYALAGTTTSTSFSEIYDTTVVDLERNPPSDRSILSSTNNYPSCVSYSQNRLIFASSNNNPQRAWCSRISNYGNFLLYKPHTDADSIVFDIVGKSVQEIKHLIEVRQLFAGTNSGEWTINGDVAGIITPTSVNAKQNSYNGLGTVQPVIVNSDIVYVQGRQSSIRYTSYSNNNDPSIGDELSIYSDHLIKPYSIVDAAYQQNPNSVVWFVRSDGKLIGLTFNRSQEMVAWHQHDFENGLVENICCIPYGSEDSLYLVVKRTIDGSTKRYIEKINTREFQDIYEATILDSYLTYDGRNTGLTTMTLSGGTNWGSTETLTLTASASFFVSGDVGNVIQLNDTDGTQIRLEISAYSSGTVVSVRPNRTVPTTLRSVATTDWAKAVDVVAGLGHLEGENVSVIGDGFVVASPNNSDYGTITVSGGEVTLPSQYAVIHVGLPITSDVNTLNIETSSGGTLANKKKLVNLVNVFIKDSRGMFVGEEEPSDAEDPLYDLKEELPEETNSLDGPPALFTGNKEIIIRSTWNYGGNVFIRQVDPLPLTILAISPEGYLS